MLDSKVRFYNNKVETFSPTENAVTLSNGDRISYEQLVVAPGIQIDFRSIPGLHEAVFNPDSPVSSIYGYETCDQVYRNISGFRKGTALFTHPAGVVKCAGAPQKIMWPAWDAWRRAGLYDPRNPPASTIQISFTTGLPVMFGVPKYSKRLDELREERGVEGLFQHDLVGVDGNTAIFARPGEQKLVRKHFAFLHAVPKMGLHNFVRNSAIANEAGFVDVDESTTRHKKYANVWLAGDASGLPTSKTAAAITAQAPVLVANLLRSLESKEPRATYDGYTSCPLLTEYGKVMLAEFKYGGEPHETFGSLVDQVTPRRAFYHLKKDFFPWVYFNSMVKGTWGGPKGWLR